MSLDLMNEFPAAETAGNQTITGEFPENRWIISRPAPQGPEPWAVPLRFPENAAARASGAV
jgi:hypothetical protein